MDPHRLETFKSLPTISIEAFKTLLLLNGGAIVALLAYLGNARAPDLAARLFCPFVSFICGLVLAALAFAGSYRTQLVLYNDPQGTTHVLWLRVTFVIALLSLFAFAIGAFTALRALAVLPS